MEFIIQEPIKILSQLLIPIVLLIATGVMQIIIRFYLSSREKNKYIKFLTNNFPPVDEYLASVITNKIMYAYFLSYAFLIVGAIVGFFFEFILIIIIGKIIDYSIDVNYIGNFLKISSETVFVNKVMFFSLSLNIGIVIIAIFFPLWIKFLNSKKLLDPKIDEHGIPVTSTSNVYCSFRFITGCLLGSYMLMIIGLADFSSRLSLFDKAERNIFFTQIRYPEIHFIVFIVVFLIAFVVFAMSSYNTTLLYEKITKLTTEFYMPNFPFIKIKTESGEVEGQLKDILNKHVVTLSDNDNLKIIQWDKIDIMEISPKNQPYVLKSESVTKKH